MPGGLGSCLSRLRGTLNADDGYQDSGACGMLKAFYIECSGGLWREIAREAQRQAGWEPILWTADGDDLGAVQEAFPGVHCQEGVCAARGIPFPTLRGLKSRAMGEIILKELAPEESIVLQMMDRMDPTGIAFNLEERRFHYHLLLQYWDSVLDCLQPDVIVFSIAPHLVFDYVLYVLAKRKGIPTPMFDRLGLPGWVYAIGGVFDPPAGWYEATGGDVPALNPEFHRYYAATVAGGKRAVPLNFARKLSRLGLWKSAKFPTIRNAWFELKRAVAIIREFGLEPVRRSYQKLPGKTPAQSVPTVIDILCSRLHALAGKRRARQALSSLTRVPVTGEPFVLLALHFQPERATVPMGGMLGDQTLIADLLAVALESLGWDLYVKEHPWQLSSYSRSEARRSPIFYERLARHPNVRLLPLDADTSSLIDEARAVATVTGSVGWQAICRGVPALVFGAAWYRDCPGAYRVANPSDIDAALADIIAGCRISQEKVREFLARIQGVCVRGYLEASVEAVGEMDDADIAGPMATILIKSAGVV